MLIPNPTATALTAYIALLKSHDWEFEFSDDARVYRAGRHSLAILRGAQSAMDLSGAVWNTYAPPHHHITPVYIPTPHQPSQRQPNDASNSPQP